MPFAGTHDLAGAYRAGADPHTLQERSVTLAVSGSHLTAAGEIPDATLTMLAKAALGSVP